MNEHLHFVTGKLAEHALRQILVELAPTAGFQYSIDVLPITVAALMTPAWIAPRLRVPDGATRIILPGYCDGDLAPIEQSSRVSVERGPKDLRDLPEYFGQARTIGQDYGAWDIEIIAEINHAPRLALGELIEQARELGTAGADVIDVGCEPGDPWSGIGQCVAALRAEGHRVSIDSLNPREIEPAVRAGAELVLSVNADNRHAAPDWGCEVVVIPDGLPDRCDVDETVELLADAGVLLRIDPVLEPIGMGFAPSLERYMAIRRRYPDAEMMMGIGNLTELTDVDSAGVNTLLLGVCQELRIHSVLTTQVINWARTSVRECDVARRLMHYAVKHRVVPKHLVGELVMLRDTRLRRFGPEQLANLARQIRDHNVRIFVEGDQIHVMSGAGHLTGGDPFALFDQLVELERRPFDAAHAFYLGFELAKAATALTLGKNYEQDESLDWGILTPTRLTPSRRPLRP